VTSSDPHYRSLPRADPTRSRWPPPTQTAGLSWYARMGRHPSQWNGRGRPASPRAGVRPVQSPRAGEGVQFQWRAGGLEWNCGCRRDKRREQAFAESEVWFSGHIQLNAMA